MTGLSFDEPDPSDRKAWALPPATGTYKRIDLALHYKPWERGDGNRYWKAPEDEGHR